MTFRRPILALACVLGLWLSGPVRAGWAQQARSADTTRVDERAVLKAERPDSLLQSWQHRLRLLAAQDSFDLHLADTFIRAVFGERRGAYYVPAADAYRELLRHASGSLSAEASALLRPHLEAMALLLSDSLRQALSLAPLLKPREDEDAELPPLHLPEDAGRTLVSWWRGHDPVPSTDANERLEQHLTRAVYAREHFTWHGRFDDRGKVYVRLGPPYKTTSVDFNDPRFRRKVRWRHPTWTAFGFRDNVFWIYPQIDYATHFLFVEHEHGRYLLGTPGDLLPSTLSYGFVPSARGDRKGAAYVRTMALIYRQLALYHMDYSSLYNKAASYAGLLDMREFTGRPLGPWHQRPSTVAQRVQTQTKTNAYHIARRRRQATPRSYGEPPEHAAALTAESVRLARFLEPDGATRTEVYWSLPTDVLAPSEERLKHLGLESGDLSGRYLLLVSLTQQTARYRTRRATRWRRLVDVPHPGAVLAPQTLVTRGDTGRYHLALQWDAYLVYENEGPDGRIRIGPHLKTDTFRADSLKALPSAAGRLVMSDLKPLLAPDDLTALDEARPYPFRRIVLGMPLALYFEIYHLTFGADDRTHYTVAYEIFRRSEQGLLERLFTGDDTQRTTTQTSTTGRSRRTEEYILLDLSEEVQPGVLVVTVRVTDEVTGQSTERSIRFEVIAPPTAEARE